MELKEAYGVVADCRRKMPTLKALATSMLNCVDELDFDYYGIFVGLETMFKEFHGQLMGVEEAIYDATKPNETENTATKDQFLQEYDRLCVEHGKACLEIAKLKDQLRQVDGE